MNALGLVSGKSFLGSGSEGMANTFPPLHFCLRVFSGLLMLTHPHDQLLPQTLRDLLTYLFPRVPEPSASKRTFWKVFLKVCVTHEPPAQKLLGKKGSFQLQTSGFPFLAGLTTEVECFRLQGYALVIMFCTEI